MFCEFSEAFRSKLLQISQSLVRFDFFPVKNRPICSYDFNPRMVRLGAPCKTIASKTAFYIGKLTNLWKSMLNLCAKLIFSLRFIAQKSIYSSKKYFLTPITISIPKSFCQSRKTKQNEFCDWHPFPHCGSAVLNNAQ